MPSAIDPTYINSDFPVAGQNNTSQGFRDNFASIKQCLETARIEIDEITKITQISLLRKLPVIDSGFYNNDLEYTQLIRPTLRAAAVPYADLGVISGQLLIDYYKAELQKVTLADSASVTFDNFPAGDIAGSIKMIINVGTAGSYLLFGNAVDSTGIVVNQRMTFSRTGNYVVEFISIDQGTRYFALGLGGF